MSEWRRMTGAERAVALAISPTRVSYPSASPPKRFASNLASAVESMGGEAKITEGQSTYLFKLRHRFRRQIPESVPYSNPEGGEHDGQEEGR